MTNTSKFFNTRIVRNNEIAPGTFIMSVPTPADIPLPRAGQFAMIYLSNGELLLPRPISICDLGHNRLDFVYQVVGKGTKALSRLRPGQFLKVLAPIGNGFFTTPDTTRSSFKNVAIVGGGIGIAPLLLLARTLMDTCENVDAYFGFRTKPFLAYEFEDIVHHTTIATEDGSVGHKGNILEVLQSQNQDYDEILACGPRPMLDALAHYAHSKAIPCQLSMEERMACGLGTCVGCVLKVSGTYQKICTEGPVFYSDNIICQH